MGAQCSHRCHQIRRPFSREHSNGAGSEPGSQVFAHVYEGGEEPLHCGLEVYGWEWSFRDETDATGIFCCAPGGCDGYQHSEALALGRTATPEEGVLKIITQLERDWSGDSFHTHNHSSIHFCHELGRQLGIEVPLKLLCDDPESAGSLGQLGATLGLDGRSSSSGDDGLLDGYQNIVTVRNIWRAPVTLNVYDIGTRKSMRTINGILMPFGTGMYHCGVEVYGWEWSYSDTTGLPSPPISGVFPCRPRKCNGHTFYQSFSLGETLCSEREVMRFVSLLEKKWPGKDYDLLQHNCGHFCQEFARMLSVNAVPAWVTSLASMADHRCGPESACCWSGEHRCGTKRRRVAADGAEGITTTESGSVRTSGARPVATKSAME